MIKDWLKFFGGSFFVNKFATEGARRSFANIFLGFILCLAFLYAGLIVGYESSFKTHYKNSTHLKQTLYAAFAAENAGERIQIKNSGYKISSGVGGNYDNSKIINTFISNTDKARYSFGGINLIVDTRPAATTYVEFEAYYEGEDGKITAEQYRALSASGRKEYKPVTKLSEKGISVDVGDGFDELKYKEFIETFTDPTLESYDADISDSYKSLQGRRANNDISQSEYNCLLYELWVKACYPDLKDDYAAAPSMRSWYVEKIFKNDEAGGYAAVLDDTLTAVFTTDGGVMIDFAGYYMAMDGFELKGDTVEQAKAQTDSFILKSFSGAKGLDMAIYLINVFKISPLVILVIVMLSLILFVIAKIFKLQFGKSFTGNFKNIASFMPITSVICFFGSIILSYAVSRGAVYSLTCLIYLSVMTVRTAILAVMETVKEKKLCRQRSAVAGGEEK